MSKIFDFIDLIVTFVQGAIAFIKQLWHIVITVIPITWDLFHSAPLVLQAFFSLFLTIAVILFVWRLIP